MRLFSRKIKVVIRNENDKKIASVKLTKAEYEEIAGVAAVLGVDFGDYICKLIARAVRDTDV